MDIGDIWVGKEPRHDGWWRRESDVMGPEPTLLAFCSYGQGHSERDGCRGRYCKVTF